MCLIIYKPKGKDWDYDAVLNGFEYNPDGAGMMYQTSQGVRIERGFDDPELLINTLLGAPELINRAVVLHFRWATHGTVNVANCHPFPVAKRVGEDMSLLTDIGIAHNGIIPNMAKDSPHSDTVQYIQGTLARVKHLLFNRAFGKKLLHATHSKFAIMDARRVKLIGEFIKDGGIFYSNDSYLPWAPLEKEEGDMALSEARWYGDDAQSNYTLSSEAWWAEQEELWAADKHDAMLG